MPKLAHHFELVEMPKNAVVFRTGEKGDRLYFIYSGSVAVYIEQAYQFGSDKVLV